MGKKIALYGVKIVAYGVTDIHKYDLMISN
jgi:hypothetical protein